MTAKMSLFWMSVPPAVFAALLLALSVMGLISDAETSLKAIFGITAVVAGLVAAMPFAFLIFGKKKGAPAAAKAAAPAAAAAGAAATAPAAPQRTPAAEELDDLSGEADVFEPAESDEFDLGEPEEEFNDDYDK